MVRVLLTGGSGFIAVHCLESLLKQGHSVVTSVRSEKKAQMIRDTFPDVGKDNLDFVLVDDIARPGAFDEAVKSDPPFEWVLHTASPFHFNVTDTKKDLLDPAIIGTTGILKAIKKNGPSVKRVVSDHHSPTTGVVLMKAFAGYHKLLRRRVRRQNRQQTRVHVQRKRLEPHHRRRGDPRSHQRVQRLKDVR